MRHQGGLLTTELHLTDASNGQPLAFQPRQVVLAGYTGRDRETVMRHIEELQAEGIAPPPSVPILYPGRADGVQVDGTVPAGIGWASGELEFVLLMTDRGTYVGVGSDHTDREMERESIVDSKQAFPKIISSQVWPLALLQEEWDGLRLESFVIQDGQRTRYQQGNLGMIMTPQDLLALVPEAERGPGLVLYSGTVPAVERAPAEGICRFEGELRRPTGQLLARCTYTYRALPA